MFCEVKKNTAEAAQCNKMMGNSNSNGNGNGNGRSRSEMERCRERRRRRAQMRRLAAAAANNSPVLPLRRRRFVDQGVSSEESHTAPSDQGGGAASEEGVNVSTVQGFVPPPPPPWNGGYSVGESSTRRGGGGGGRYSWVFGNDTGESSHTHSHLRLHSQMVVNGPDSGNDVPIIGVVAIAGRQRDMEDAVAIQTSLCSPPINRSRPLHFFGVFDGHGGSHVAFMCKNKMHVFLKDELMRARYPMGVLSWPINGSDAHVEEEEWKKVFRRCFARTEMAALQTCSCGSVGFRCACTDRTTMFRSGSTAVAVVVTQEHIMVANCGDSRAILCRGGRVVPLSVDHKPDRADERARIEACGGHVYFLDTARVEGVLAMSRAIGDNYLKPSVTSEPEVTFTRRAADDEFLILASDGLWDVMSNEMACRVARECLREPPHRAAADFGSVGVTDPENDAPRLVFPSQSASAAALLTRLALGRGTRDNICVVVVDLKRAI